MRNCSFLSVKTDTAYVETYLSVPGFELTYVQNGLFRYQGALDITLLYLKDTTVFTADHYVLLTPELPDTTNVDFNILDLRRVSLPDGEYTVKLKISDANNPAAFCEVNQGLNVSFNRTGVSMSDIELVQSYSQTVEKNVYSKNGYDIKPFAISYFPNSVSKLAFYSEIYHADVTAPQEDIIITYAVKHAQQNEVAHDLFRFTKQKSGPLNVLFSEFDITDLPTGNYYLEVQVKNRKNELLTDQIAFFQRMNNNSSTELSNIALIDVSDKFVSLMPGDSMKYYCESIMPKAELYEREYIQRAIASNDTLLMKQFFFNFWQKRSEGDPYLAWIEYNKMVEAVNYNFGTPVSYGFETDRGRVYLQYGPPNRIDGHQHESGAYPYEIWQYYSISGNQSNVKFVFCNSDLVTNDYKLIHSTARGEIYDARWQFKIYKTFKETSNYYDLDQEKFHNIYGSDVDDYYENR
jgi:GWxTD domain-containing protein